jgi:hypothetical protein
LQGPFTLADYVGLDTTLSILKNWTSMYPGEPAFIVPKSLEVKVRRQLIVRAPASREVVDEAVQQARCFVGGSDAGAAGESNARASAFA